MRMLTRSRDARAGVVAAVLGTVYLAAAFTIEPDPSSTSVVGPQVAPIVIGAATVVCAVALVVQVLRRGDGDRQEEHGQEPGQEYGDTEGESSAPAPGIRGLTQRQVLVTFTIFGAYIVAFIPLGFLLSTFLFLVAMTTYVERNKLLRNCIFGAVFSPAVYVLFNYGLQVELPSPGLFT
jgi:putative tricarboxylic transport membrane protein